MDISPVLGNRISKMGRQADVWIPWRGPFYDDRRTLIVGESCYNWQGSHGTERPQIYHAVVLVSDQLTEPA